MKKYLIKIYNILISKKRLLIQKFKELTELIQTKNRRNFLSKTKFIQKQRYDLLKHRFWNYYKKLQKYNEEKFVTKTWQQWNKKLEKCFLPYPPFNFLNLSIIKQTMFISHNNWAKEELKLLKEKFNDTRLQLLLMEDYIGKPPLANINYITSYNSIHHLYHLANYLDQTGVELNKVKTILEWGGGYGNFIKILKRFLPSGKTFILIDTTIFSCLQWLYLSSIFGEKEINFLINENSTIKSGLINIIPVALLNEKIINTQLNTQFFISTWAISESMPEMQNFVANHNFFNAKHILISLNEKDRRFPISSNFINILQEKECQIKKIEFIPGSYYIYL